MIAKLTQAIAAVAPIHGVSVERPNDKATWRIDFKDEATPEQRAAAAEVLAAFDVGAAEASAKKERVNAPILAALAKSDAAMLRAIEEGDAEKIAQRRAERQALRGQLVK